MVATHGSRTEHAGRQPVVGDSVPLLGVARANQAELQGADRGLCAAAHTQLAEDAAEMVAHSARTESNLHPDLTIGLALDEQAQDLDITRRQRRRQSWRGGQRRLIGTVFAERLPDELAQTLLMFEKLA